MHISSAVICVVDREFVYEDVYTAVGDSVTIQCHRSDLTPILWQYRYSEEQSVHDVYDGELFYNGCLGRCSIDNSTYDLTVVEVKVDDTGEYWCVEDEGFGDKHVTKLFVTGLYRYCYMVLKLRVSKWVEFNIPPNW